jgi:formylglycine-generating enzyme required for sulfatase activity
MDMSGNVWEWCLNRYDQPEVDKTNLDSYDRRVIRGGSWRSDQPCVTTLFRDLDSPDVRSSDFGFRLLRPGPG